ncbi:MAG TPA: protoheme IX farnesyltransferase, partial [Marinobacter sp.]
MSERIEALPARATDSRADSASISWRDFLELTKPKVVAMMILTSVIGMLLATPGVPGWEVLVYGNLGIALLAGAAAVVNHVVDQK